MLMEECSHYLYVQVLVFLCCSAITAAVTSRDIHIAANQTVRLTNLGEIGYIQSAGFPHKCCEEQTITLKLEIPAQLKSFIHLVFSDLDLPAGTDFKIYKEANDEAQNMFRDQPDYKYGMWRRPFVSSTSYGQVIHLVLKAPRTNNYNASYYAGFKASYVVSKDETPLFRLTSDLCPSISNVLEGSSVTVKPQPTANYDGKYLDCVWHIKTPDGAIGIPGSEEDQFRTYIRFTSVSLTKGNLEIRRGTTSLSPEVTEGNTLAKLRQPAEGFTVQQGFYVHLSIPADDRQNKFSFIYGVIHHLASGVVGACDAGFQCPNNLNWCIPMKNKCNNVDNCPDGADELMCDVEATTKPTTTTPSTTTHRWTTSTSTTKPYSCTGFYAVDCGDGRCLRLYGDCSTTLGMNGCDSQRIWCTDGSCIWKFDTCPDECSSYEKKCSDGSCISSDGYCSDESCPYGRSLRCENHHECFSETDRCDGYSDCRDGTDENNCEPISMLLYSLLVIPALIMLCGVGCYKCCRNRPNSSAECASAFRTGLGALHVPEDKKLYFLLLIPIVMVFCCCCCYYCCRKKSAETRSLHPGSEERTPLHTNLIYLGLVIIIGLLVGVSSHYLRRSKRRRQTRAVITHGNNDGSPGPDPWTLIEVNQPLIYSAVVLSVMLVMGATAVVYSYVVRKNRTNMRANRAGPPGNDNRMMGKTEIYLLIFMVGIPIVLVLSCGVICYKYCRGKPSRGPQPDPPHTVPHVYTGTRLQPVTTNTSTNNSPLLSSHGYTGVGSTTYTDPSIGLTEISISHDSTPRPEATAPPPSYEEVLNTDMYPHGQIDSQREPPPPSYDTAIQGPQIHIL